jgi:PAS domain S-box-containing protein
MNATKTKSFVLPVIVVLAWAVFAMDLLTPEGYADWIWYLLLMFYSLYVGGRYIHYSLAAGFSALILAGYYWASQGIDAQIAYGSRLMGILVLWIMAVILSKRNQAESERARAFRQLADTSETLAALTKITTNAVSTLELNELMTVLLERLVEVMKGDTAAILLRENEQLTARASVGIEAAVQAQHSVPIGEGFAGTIARTLKPLYIADVQTDERAKSPFIRERGIRSLIGVPMSRNETIVGVIHVGWLSPHPQQEKELHLLKIIAERCALAILNAQLYEKSRANEERYHQLIELSPDAILVYRDNQVDFVNSAALKLFGASGPEQLVGKSYSDILSPDCHAVVAERIRAALEEGKPAPAMEENIIRLDGTTRSTEVTTAPFTDERGKALLVDLRDVTERKRATELVLESEGRFRSLVEDSPDVIGIFQENRLQFINAAGVRLFGASSQEELLGGTGEQFIHPQDRASAADRIRRRLAGETGIYPAEVRYIRVDGTPLPMEVSAAPIMFRGKPAVQFIARDISARKRADAQLRDSEALYHSLVENLPQQVFRKDLAGRFTFGNGPFCQSLGKPLGDILGKTDQDFFPPHLAAKYQRDDRYVMQTEQTFDAEEEHQKADGQTITVRVIKTPIRDAGGTITGVQGIAWDITERKRAEDKLKLFRNLIDQTDDAIEVLDVETGQFLDMNATGCRDLGYKREEILSLTVFDVDPTFDPAKFREGNETLRKTGSRIWEGIHRRKDGSTFPVEVNVRCVKLDRDYILAVVRNIAERKRVEAKLQLQSSALAAAANGIVITDHAGMIVWVNPAFTRLTGYSAEEIIGQYPRLFKSGKHDPAFYKDLWDTILAGQVWRGEMINRHKDGQLYTEQTTITPVRDAKGEITHFIGIKQDVTQQRGLEIQLRQAQRMEAIGQLAGGVAHDFNNMLAVIRGNAELLLMDDDQLNRPVRDGLKQIHAAADRAANLTRQLLAFSRKQVMQLQPSDFNDVIANLTKMLNRVIGEHIELQCTYAKRLPFVQADVGMLEQVLVNLTVNARDAMPKGGQLVIATGNVQLTDQDATRHPEAVAGDFVCLSVSDTGMGIAPEHLPQIFEPFFTTKELGRGTGLGLATVYGIVKQHGGWLEVSTQVGVGTTFTIFLPAIPSSAEPAATTPEPPLRGGNETILVVEDDQAVRSMNRRVLESFGYHVEEAASGREALASWKQCEAKIDLLLTDMVMPGGVTGRDLGEQLRAQKPALKVIYTSGYSATMAGKDTAFLRRTNSYYLQKPCPTRLLIHTVRQCLDEA